MSEETTVKKSAKKIGIVQFYNEVRAEARKVTWASMNEVRLSSFMVVLMAIFAAAFFFLADSLMKSGVGGLLALAQRIGSGS